MDYKESPEYGKAKILEASSKARSAYLEVKEKEGELVRAEDLRAALALMFRFLGERLQAMPDDLVSSIREHLPSRTKNKIEGIVREELRGYIEEMNLEMSEQFMEWLKNDEEGGDKGE